MALDYVGKIIKCQCGTEGYEVQVCEEEGEVYISFWQRGSASRKSWGVRLRHIWRTLKKGHPFEDQVCLDKETALVLAAAIKELAERIPSVQ